MLLYFLFFLSLESILAPCDHDIIQRQVPNPFHDEISGPSLLNKKITRKPIRIFFDLSSIKQSIKSNAANSSNLLEENEDLKKLKNLEITLQNLADFSSRLLKVTRLEQPFVVNSKQKIKTDLFISVQMKNYPKGSKILGQAYYTQTNKDDNRPIKGAMNLNKEYFPDEPQNEHSLERLFFSTIFHEMCHVFGISGTAMKRWINRETGKPYSPLPLTKYFNQTYQKTFHILHTPAARRYIEQRFGITEFAPGVPAGIEIEDGGGPGTEGSHPESRVYLSENLCGIFVGYTFISNLTLALLEDTGWYDVDYSMGEKYAWGDGKSMGKGPLTTFINTAPQISYPPHYMCLPNNTGEQCHYDFRAKAYCSPIATYNCTNSSADDQQCCKMKNFTNPLNWPIRGGREEFDFLIFKVPNVSLRCQDTSLNDQNAVIHGEFFSEESMCAMSTLSKNEQDFDKPLPGCYFMKCDKEGNLLVTVGNSTQNCNYENKVLHFDGFNGQLYCPPPDLVCSMKNFLFDQSTSKNTPYLAFIRSYSSLIILGVILVLCAITYTIISKIHRYFFRKKYNDINPPSTDKDHIEDVIVIDVNSDSSAEAETISIDSV